jgi:hypothetical protein
MSLYNPGSGALVGPGALTQYEGRPGRQRARGFVRVSKYPDGFFVAGSSLTAMNGLYGRVQSVPLALTKTHEFKLAYKNDNTGYIMAMVDVPDQAFPGADDAEWVFIDEDGRDRFTHPGDTIVPGSGTRWAFAAPRETRNAAAGRGGGGGAGGGGGGAASVSVVEREEEHEDQLPWQVIAILSADMLEKLRRHWQWYEYDCRMARGGGGLAKLEAGPHDSVEQEPPAELAAELSGAAAASPEEEEAAAARDAGRFDKAASLFAGIIAALLKEEEEDPYAYVCLRRLRAWVCVHYVVR